MVVILSLGGMQKCWSQRQKIELTFKQTLALALKNDLTLKLAQQNIKAAQADLRYSKTRKLPKLSLMGYSGAAQYRGGIPVFNSFSVPAEEFELRPTLYGEIGLYFWQVLFDNKQTFYEIREKSVILEAAENEITRTRTETLFQAATAYCRASHAETTLIYLGEEIELQKRLSSQFDNYFAAGLISKIEIEKIQQSRFELQDRVGIVNLKNLELIMNLHAILDIPKDEIIQIETSHDIDFLKICRQARGGNGQIVNLEHKDAELEVKINDIRTQRAQKHNTIFVNLESYLKYSTSQSWVIGIGIHWPVWDGGEREALVELAQARHAAARTNLEIRKERINQRLELTHAKLLIEYEKLQSLDLRINALEIELSNAVGAQAGLEETLLVNRRRLDLLSLQLEKANSLADFHSTCLEFLKQTNCIEKLLAQ